MDIAVVSRKAVDSEELAGKIKEISSTAKIVEKAPEVVISYGGDGTFLVAERRFPGVQKLIIKKDSVCKKCVDGELNELITKLVSGKLKVEEHRKLEVKINGRNVGMLATNDIILRNKNQYEALRFDVEAGGKKIEGVIGDGVVVSTAFGSTGYFHSMTRKEFHEGVGLALNNPTILHEPIVEKALKVKLKISRSPGFVSVDNNLELFDVKVGDVIEVFESAEKFRVLNH